LRQGRSTPVSTANKIDCYKIAEILLKVALNTINQQTNHQITEPIRTKLERNGPWVVPGIQFKLLSRGVFPERQHS